MKYISNRRRVESNQPFPQFSPSKIICSTKSLWLANSLEYEGLLNNIKVQVEPSVFERFEIVELTKHWDAQTQETWWEIDFTNMPD